MLERIGPWSFATVAVSLTAVVILAILHVDTQVIFNMLIALGIGYGGLSLAGMRTNVNGNVERLTALLEKAYEYQAKSPALSTKDDNGPA